MKKIKCLVMFIIFSLSCSVPFFAFAADENWILDFDTVCIDSNGFIYLSDDSIHFNVAVTGTSSTTNPNAGNAFNVVYAGSTQSDKVPFYVLEPVIYSGSTQYLIHYVNTQDFISTAFRLYLSTSSTNSYQVGSAVIDFPMWNIGSYSRSSYQGMTVYVLKGNVYGAARYEAPTLSVGTSDMLPSGGFDAISALLDVQTTYIITQVTNAIEQNSSTVTVENVITIINALESIETSNQTIIENQETIINISPAQQAIIGVTQQHADTVSDTLSDYSDVFSEIDLPSLTYVASFVDSSSIVGPNSDFDVSVITGTLGSILNNTFILTAITSSLTLAVLSYIFFGKKG